MRLIKNSKKRASEVFQVHYKTVLNLNWVRQWETTKELSPKPRNPKPAYKLDYSQLREQVLAHPDWYQYEHAQIFGVSQSAISKALSKMGITVKKKPAIMKNKIRKKSRHLIKNERR